MADRTRIEVGFDGGQVLSLLADAEAVESLEQGLQSGVGSVTVDAEDGRYTLALARIVYVKRSAREARVGFGPAA